MTITKLNQQQMKEALKEMISDEYFNNPDDIKIGNVENIEVKSCRTRDGQEFDQIIFHVRADDGKQYHKRMSVDFTRKYLNQIGVKAKDIIGQTIVFKVKNKFKECGMFAFLSYEKEDEDHAYYVVNYFRDEEEDFMAKLEKLGL